MKKISQSKGFTLVEVIMTALIFTMIMGGLYAGMIAGGRSWQTYDAQAISQREARRAVIWLSRDLRMAGDSGLVFSRNSPDEVTFSFQHPDDGRVTYSWSRLGDDGGGPGMVRRLSAKGSRQVAVNISALVVREAEGQIIYDVTASSTVKAGGQSGSSGEFHLAGKVSKR